MKNKPSEWYIPNTNFVQLTTITAEAYAELYAGDELVTIAPGATPNRCAYCRTTAPGDERGNCSACGAPR